MSRDPGPARMPRHAAFFTAAALLLSGGLTLPAGGQSATVRGTAGGESGFWQLWMRQEAAPTAHDELASAWRGFAGGAPAGDPFAPVAHTLAAWHELKAGRRAEAEALLERYVNADSTEGTVRGAREIARAWLTCLDRERLVTALEAYRRLEVRYPDRLADLEAWTRLPTVARPPFQDRWGTPWVYRPEPLRSMPALQAQRYSLTSRTLAELSVLKTALALRHGERIDTRPVQVRTMTQGPPAVTLRREDAGAEPMIVQAGSSRAGLMVAYVSPSLILLCDRLHWKVFANPTR